MKLKDLPVSDVGEFAEAVANLSWDEVYELLLEGAELLKRLPEGGIFPIAYTAPDSPYAFHGDLHGDIVTVFELWEKIGTQRILNEYKLVFLGDYVDRGPKQLEALLLPLALKARRPSEVIVLRGNHEPVRGLEPLPHDFPHYLARRFRGKGEKLYSVAKQVFENMPLVLYVEGSVVAFHGGPPTVLVRRGCEGTSCLFDDKIRHLVVEEILWNEPGEICSWDDPPETCWAPSPRGRGYLWGPGVTNALLRFTKTKFLVRANTPIDGVKFFHMGRGVSVFSRRGMPFANEKGGIWAPNFLDRQWWAKPDKWVYLT
ncbi:hypothetical protein IPA_05570 [Ignicoccus pacificus DSM 13166]|uniref:Serine/threonine specific protein phosphatases domain-containing protein n=1 Tax=Ignicoccus pacificus DSM 13166 TaxID=940294 RepID=A0A977PKY6_9CREN|nr:hypothetical protein IPA_05570 [Ignicoccus pacificus DSM 13166]